MADGSTSRSSGLVMDMTSDVISSTSYLSVAIDDEMSQTAVAATATTSRDSRHVTPPINASGFDYVWQLDNLSSVRQVWFDDPAFMPTAVVYSLAFVFGFLGNLFVALALIVDRRQRAVLAAADSSSGSHHLTTSFLVSLAIADVVFLLVCLPYELTVKLESVWRGGLALCKLAGFVEMITATASVLNLSAVSIERFAFFDVFKIEKKTLYVEMLIASKISVSLINSFTADPVEALHFAILV